MAGKIQGLTVKLFGDASQLNKAMEDSKKKAKELERELYQINQTLKIDPNNNILYTQKQNALSDALKNAQTELQNLEKVHKKAVEEFASGKIGQDELDALNRQIIISKKKIKGLETQIINTAKSASKLAAIKGEIDNIDKAIEESKKRLKDFDKALELDPKNLELIKLKQDEYNKTIELTKDKVKLLEEAQEEAYLSLKKNGAGSEEYAQLTVEVSKSRKELKQLIKDSNEAARKLEKTGDVLKKSGDKISSFGKDMTMKVSTPLIGAGGVAVKNWMDLESAMTGVHKTTDLSQNDLKEMEKTFREMSKTIPITAVELANIGEIAGQLAISKENIPDFARVMAMLDVATDMTSDEAANRIARFMNIFGTGQEKAENLGSAIVHLGNNYATSEPEIMEMSQRLAAQASLLKLTEGQTLGLATAMSAAGLGPEAGGSAMTSILQKMNEAGRGLTQISDRLDEVFEGTSHTKEELINLFNATPKERNAGLAQISKDTNVNIKQLRMWADAYIDAQFRLEEFARIARVSKEDFATMFSERPEEALLVFLTGLRKINDEGGDVASTLKLIGIRGIREKDTIQRLVKSVEILQDAFVDGDRAFAENTALVKEAELRFDDAAQKVQLLKNNLTDLTITIAEKIMPFFNDVVKQLTEKINSLDNMGDDTIKKILKVGGALIILGPASTILGKVLKIFGGIFKVSSLLFDGFKLFKSGLGLASGGLTLFAGSGGPVLLAVAAISGLVLVIKNLYDELTKDYIGDVDLFDGLSDGTKKAVGGFLELEEEATKSLNRLKWSGDKVSKEAADDISSNFSSMSDTLKSAFDDKRNKIEDLFIGMPDLKATSEEEMSNALGRISQHYDEQEAMVKDYEDRATKILQKASSEKRALTVEELTEINQIKGDMQKLGIETLSENEEEANIILQRMKEQHSKISAQQAAEVVKQSAIQRDKTIENALEEYNERMSIIKTLKNSNSKESQELAKKLEFDANYAKTKAIESAEAMHRDVVNEAKKQAGEHVMEVDWETGEILSKWEVFGINLNKGLDEFALAIEKGFIIAAKAVRDVVKWTGERIDDLVGFFTNLHERISKALGNLWEKIKSPFETVKKKIEGLFNFKIKNPEPSIPKPMVRGIRGSSFMNLPNIQWYKSGAIFSKPTLFNTPYGIKGVGEAGAEAVMPIDNLKSIIAEVINGSQNLSGAPIIIEKMVVRDEYDIQKISEDLYKLIERRNRGVGIV